MKDVSTRRGRRFGLIVAAASISMLALAVGWVWFTLSWPYSEGERAGVLQEFSRKGWVCKTYEGELAMYVVGGVAPQIWHFSTRDEQLARRLSAAVGKQVRLHYTEHRGVPTRCFAETPYFVDHFVIVERPGWTLPPDDGR